MKIQAVAKKSKNDPLFLRLYNVYQPAMFIPHLLPFPVCQIAQARAWRGHAMPDPKMLIDEIRKVDPQSVYQLDDGTFGVHPRRLGFIIPLVESLFRPMRAVELALEELFPDFLFGSSETWPPSDTVTRRLQRDFLQDWKEKERVVGDGWVLAVGHTPLPIRHKPRLIAPWVIGVIVERWLIEKKIPGENATNLAVGLATVLLGQTIRPEEFEHWRNLSAKVLVTSKRGKTPLPAYLASLISDFGSCNGYGHKLTPSMFLKLFPIDSEACQKFAWWLSRAWAIPGERAQKKPSRSIPKEARRLTEPVAITDHDECPGEGITRPCGMCGDMIPLDKIYGHLEGVHDISRDSAEAFPNRKELREKRSGKVLYKY